MTDSIQDDLFATAETPESAQPDTRPQEAAPAPASESDSEQARQNALYAEWNALAAEHHQLIRIAPLPADRDTGLRPLIFGSLGRVSRHSEQMSMLKLSLELTGYKTGKGINQLEVWLDHERKEVRFMPEEGLRTEPANRGLGRFLMALAARWVQHKCAHYSVQSTPLLVKLVSNDSARLRRDYALQTQGFTVAYEDGVQMRANCSAARASQIHKDWNIDKVRIIEIGETAEILQTADKNLREQERELKKLNQQLELLKRDDNTLKFTISMLVIFAVFQAVLLIWMATR